MASESSGEQVTSLRERVALFKKQARLLLERFEKREISQVEARAGAERLEREVRKTEAHVEELEAQRRRSN